jgi:hypothetical protein
MYQVDLCEIGLLLWTFSRVTKNEEWNRTRFQHGIEQDFCFILEGL